ncbi:unnamed protein product [Penicillium olsonii]|nr:unnamed protein product [Penicillium olsonii]CAG7933848.1 unnamed protein product [Penicillium olsonii]
MMKSSKSRRGGTGSSDRGGIRKRGPTRTDRDGDMDMDSATSRARRNRTETGRAALGGRMSGAGAGGRAAGSGGRAQARDRNIDLIQRAIASTDSQASIRQNRGNGKSKDHLDTFCIRGWKNSKAASNKDHGREALVAYLERRMNSFTKSGPRIRLTQHEKKGPDTLLVHIKPDLGDKMLRLNGSTFAGVKITVAPYNADDALASELAPEDGAPGSTADTKTKMLAILDKRYFAQNKLLDMSDLAGDLDLQEMGIFNSTSTESKFFPALMKVWETRYDSSAARREAVESASLANNNLSNISVVTTLAQAVPDIKNLDLSNNKFKDAQAIIGWRWKFRNLVFLDMTGNDFCSLPNFKDTMLKWYPKLQVLNNVQVRTPEEVALQKKTPIPVQPPHFHDESQIGENFVRAFFAGYDNDRNGLVSNVYDNESKFSLNINTISPRSLNSEPVAWGEYIKKSRNLDKISHLPARMSRSFKGVDQIREAFSTLPPSRHPDLTTKADQWLIECYPLPGLPDPSGQSAFGVGGLSLTVHGQLEESVAGKLELRSFDRTFILGPGNTPGGIRILSDLYCLRAYGGHDAWIPDSIALPPTAAPVPDAAPAAAPAAAPNAADGYGLPQPGKSDTQLQQEQIVAQMSAKSGMTIQYSEMALVSNNWDAEAAWKNFEELKASGTLPPTAFLTPS